MKALVQGQGLAQALEQAQASELVPFAGSSQDIDQGTGKASAQEFACHIAAALDTDKHFVASALTEKPPSGTDILVEVLVGLVVPLAVQLAVQLVAQVVALFAVRLAVQLAGPFAAPSGQLYLVGFGLAVDQLEDVDSVQDSVLAQ